MTSNRSTVIAARHNAKSEDHRDPTVHRVKIDPIKSSDITLRDVTRGGVTPVNVSPSQVSGSDRNQELIAEATDPKRSVTSSRDNVKRDVKLSSDIKVTEKQNVTWCLFTLTRIPHSL